MWAKIITIKRTNDFNYFSLCAFNLFNTRVSQFELNYWNKWTFPRHSNLLRCTCIHTYMCVCMKLQQVTTTAMVKNDHLKPPVGLSGLNYTIHWHIHTQINDVMCVLSIILSVSALVSWSGCMFLSECFKFCWNKTWYLPACVGP